MEQEHRPSILSEPIHNLAKDTTTGRLVLLDNESGLLDAYALLYPSSTLGPPAQLEAARFRSMQRALLHTTCVFRRTTLQQLFGLYRAGDAVEVLEDFLTSSEPLYRQLVEEVGEGKMAGFREHFQERLEEVWGWLKECQEAGRGS